MGAKRLDILGASMSNTPKIDMVTDYLLEHYPDHAEKLAANKLISYATVHDDYSNPQIEGIIDKIALFNGYEKL
jgi:IMP cyclohydrolase